MSYECDIYFNPEKYGLKALGEIEYSSGHWEFDTLVIWVDAEGNLLWGEDSGCSCPTPFEDHTLEGLERGDFETLRQHALGRAQRHTSYHEGASVAEVEEILARVKGDLQ